VLIWRRLSAAVVGGGQWWESTVGSDSGVPVFALRKRLLDILMMLKE